MTENNKDTDTSWNDPDDAPELTDDFFDEAERYEGDKFIKKGRGKQKAATKELVSIRLSPEVIEHFRSDGPGWQTRIDEALKSFVASKRLADTVQEVKENLSEDAIIRELLRALRDKKGGNLGGQQEAS